MKRYPPVGELSYTSHETGISLWNHPVVLKPKIKYIAQKESSSTSIIDTVEPRYEKLSHG
jgi:hypothetical protein